MDGSLEAAIASPNLLNSGDGQMLMSCGTQVLVRGNIASVQEHHAAFGATALPVPEELPFHPLNVKGKEIEAGELEA